MNRDEILATELDESFIELMKDRLVEGYNRWGPVDEYLSTSDRGDGREATVESYEHDVARLIGAFKLSREPKLLADAANYLMFLYRRETHYPETVQKW